MVVLSGFRSIHGIFLSRRLKNTFERFAAMRSRLRMDGLRLNSVNNMIKKFRKRDRISVRADWWDYGWNGAYYVTICTKDRVCVFGDVVTIPKPHVQLSEIGKIAYQYWEEIPDHFPFVELGEFVVMPNHMHGIVVIDRPGNDGNARIGYVPRDVSRTSTASNIHVFDGSPVGTPNLGVPTVTPDSTVAPRHNAISDCGARPDYTNVPADQNHESSNNSTARWKPGTLGVILNQYKRKCTIEARKIWTGFGWQSRFHDHIIRDAEEFERISKYIRDNPAKWISDRFYRA